MGLSNLVVQFLYLYDNSTIADLRKLFLILLFIPYFGNAQDYVDLVKIGFGQTLNNDFEGTTSSTKIQFSEIDITFPVVLNEKNALITGASFSQNNLQLFPEANKTNLYSTLLKVGLATTYNDKWSSTIVLLPKVASDYQNITSDDFFIGGFGILKLKKKENLIYRFGIYASTEAFGVFSTPIIGWYYLSPNKKFEMDMSLPIAADINYNLGFATLGVDYFGIGRSYNLRPENGPKLYVDQSSLDFSGYIQFPVLQKSILLRAKTGYATSKNEVYLDGENIDFGVSAFTFGDDRTQLNPTLSGGVFLKFEAIYRFNLSQEKRPD